MRKMACTILSEERGEIAVLLACYMVILILCLALVMDLGNTYLTQLQMRNAVDLASAAVASKIPSPYSDAAMESLRELAETTVQRNGVAIEQIDMTCELLNNEEQIYAARIILEKEVHHFFAQIYLNQTSIIRVGNLVYMTQDEASQLGYRITIVDS